MVLPKGSRERPLDDLQRPRDLLSYRFLRLLLQTTERSAVTLFLGQSALSPSGPSGAASTPAPVPVQRGVAGIGSGIDRGVRSGPRFASESSAMRFLR